MKKFITRAVIGFMAIAIPAFAAGGGYNDGNLPVGSNIGGNLVLVQGGGAGTPSSIVLTHGTGLPLAGILNNTANSLAGFNGSGVASDVSIGAGCTLSGSILSCAGTGGSGTVTSASVVSANGFSGSVATATTTPAITLSTSISGILKGSAGALAAATSGTDYAPATTGSSILKASSGGFANASAGTDYVAPGGALGTPSSGVVTNLTGTASGLTAGAVATISGLITAGSNVTITGSGTSGSPYSIAASGSGFSAFNTITSGTNTTAAMVVGSGGTLGVSGSGTIAATSAPASGITGTLGAGSGGTGQTSVASSFTSFFESVATTLGDIVYGGASGAPTRLGGNTSATTSILTETGTGAAAQAPAWTLPASMTPAFIGSAITAINGSNISSGTVAAARLPAATISTLGVVSTDGATLTNTAGAIACATATTGQLGCVKPDGTIITDTAGLITVPKATSGAFGVIEGDGATLALTAGVLSLNTANANTWSAIQSMNDGDLVLNGSSSGAMTLHAPAAASTFSMSFPAATDTVSVLGTAQTFTAAKTFTNSDLLILGSSTGATTITSANAGASNFTATLPALTDTIAEIAATQTLTNKSIAGSEINSGTVSASFLPTATGSALGVTQAGTGLTATAGVLAVNSSQSIATLSNLTSNGVVTTSGGSGTLGITATSGTGSVCLTTNCSMTTPALGTPSAVVLTNATGTASSLTAGTATNANNVATTSTTGNSTFFPLFVGSSTNSNQAPELATALNFNASTGNLSSTVFTGAGTGLTGTAASLTAGNVTTNANLTGAVTSVGNATTYAGTVPTTKGGTGTATTFTQNSIVYAGASGNYAQDNTNFSWNDSTDLFTVGGSENISDVILFPSTTNAVVYNNYIDTYSTVTGTPQGVAVVDLDTACILQGSGNTISIGHCVGLKAEADDNGTGTYGQLIASEASSSLNTGSSGSVTNMIDFLGYFAGNSVTGVAITNHYGLDLTNDGLVDSNITNNYGLYINAIAGTGTVTNDWSIYSPDTHGILYNQGNVGIGINVPAAKLDVWGAIDISSNNAISFPSDGAGTGASIAIGPGALASQAAAGTASYYNTAVGFLSISGGTMTTAATGNTAIGFGSDYLNTAGNSNVAIGSTALLNNEAGSGSTAVGFGAMTNANNSTTPFTTFNTAIGYDALAGGSPVSGNTGISNTAIGSFAMAAVTSGSYNIAIGEGTANALTTGAQNIIIGAASQLGAVSDNNEGVYGFNITGAGSNTVTLGNTSNVKTVANGYVATSGVVSAGTKFTASGCSNSTTVGGATAGSFHSGTSGTCTVTITMNGATGITAPNGWDCAANDLTTTTDKLATTASTATTATIAGTTVSGDVISFHCMGY